MRDWLTLLVFEAAAPEIDDFETALGRVSEKDILQHEYGCRVNDHPT
jgi:hypothetical protein